MRHPARTGAVVTAVTVAVSFLTVCVPAVGTAGASAVAAGTGGSSWAYGSVKSVSASGHAGLYAYTASATAGFAVILNETVVSNASYSLQVDRTMGLLLSVEYCRPSCHSPLESASVSYRTWESLNATLNLTTSASVNVSGQAVPALGLTASGLQVSAGLRLDSAVVIGGTTDVTRNLTVSLNSNSSSTYTPTLGLLPLKLSAPESWTASSAFDQTGLATWAVHDVRVGGLLPGTIEKSGKLGLNASGNITLAGTDSGTTMRLGGTTYNVLNLSVAKGPFDLREGFLLVPSASDFFGGTAPAWLTTNANDTGYANVSQANIDVTGSMTGTGHLGFDGSGVWLSSGTDNPASVTVAGSGLAPAAVHPASGTNATYLQGAPESVGQATTDQNCLTGGIACPFGSAPRGHLGEYLVLGGAAVAVVLAVAVVATRRRVPPPAYPNANLYPPGASPKASPGPPPAPPAPPAEDDPLGNLW